LIRCARELHALIADCSAQARGEAGEWERRGVRPIPEGENMKVQKLCPQISHLTSKNASMQSSNNVYFCMVKIIRRRFATST
jgi:hypothetical protein